MTAFYDRLSEIMDETGIRKVDITNALGYGEPHFASWKKGSNPRKDTIRKIAEYINISTDYLSGNSDEKTPFSQTKLVSYDVDKVRTIPLFNGLPDSDDIFSETKYIDQSIPCSNNLKTLPDLFAIVAVNDTMSPIINAGDIIIAKLTSECEQGDLCIYRLYGSIGVRWFSSNDTEITLEAEHVYNDITQKGYKNIIISKDKESDFDFKLIGQVVEVRKVLRNLHRKS